MVKSFLTQPLTVPHDTLTEVPFGRFEAPMDGPYLALAQIAYVPCSDGFERSLFILHHTKINPDGRIVGANETSGPKVKGKEMILLQTFALVMMEKGDTLSLGAYQNSGHDLRVIDRVGDDEHATYYTWGGVINAW